MHVSKKAIGNALGLIQTINDKILECHYLDDTGYELGAVGIDVNGCTMPCTSFNYEFIHRGSNMPTKHKDIIQIGLSIVTTKKNMKHILKSGGLTVEHMYNFDPATITDVIVNKSFSDKLRSYKLILSIPLNSKHYDNKPSRSYMSYSFYNTMPSGAKDYVLGEDDFYSDKNFSTILKEIEETGFFKKRYM